MKRDSSRLERKRERESERTRAGEERTWKSFSHTFVNSTPFCLARAKSRDFSNAHTGKKHAGERESEIGRRIDLKGTKHSNVFGRIRKEWLDASEAFAQEHIHSWCSYGLTAFCLSQCATR